MVDLALPGGKTIRTISSPVFTSRADKRAPGPAPDIGAHTREVLREVGYSDQAVDAMLASGAIATCGTGGIEG
jgi:formyl-CoA transferase